MSSNLYCSPPRERTDVRPPMDVSRYIGLMIPGCNHTWNDSRSFANMRVNIDDVNAETVMERGLDYISAAGGWLKLWWHLDNLSALSCRTTGRCDITGVRCDEEVEHQCRLDTLVSSASFRDEDLTPSLDWICFDNPYDRHCFISPHSHFTVIWTWRIASVMIPLLAEFLTGGITWRFSPLRAQGVWIFTPRLDPIVIIMRRERFYLS